MKINPGTLPRKIWKYNGKSIFFTFLNTDQNGPELFFKNCNYIVLFKKSAFGINFGAREVLELKMLSRRRLNIFRSSTSQALKLIPKADFLKSTIYLEF